jgi:cytochrome d ubiquinol oxidase subunit II
MTVLLAILFCGYFVLAGLDYGVALVAQGKPELDRIAPFFLANEVWLVAAIGLLFGAFPADEGVLLGAYRVPLALALLGVVLVTATFGLRLFSRPAPGVGATAPASHPGAPASHPGAPASHPGQIRVMAQILAHDPGHNPDLAARDGGGGSGARAGEGGVGSGGREGGVGALDGVARIGGALAALGWGAVLGAIWHGGDFSLNPAVIGGALGMLAVVGVHGWAYLRRRWAILVGTSAVLVGSVAAVGSTVTWHPASSAAIDLLAPVTYVLVPLLIVIQAATWWLFRARHDSEPRSAAGTGSA